MLGVDQGDSLTPGRNGRAMKILYLCADWGIPINGFKGASVHVREFVNTLGRLGHEVALVFANKGEGNPDPRALLIERPPLRNPMLRAGEALRLGLGETESDEALSRELDKLAYDRLFAEAVLKDLTVSGFAPDVIYERYALFHKAGAAIARALAVPRIVEVNAPLVEEQEKYRGLRLKSVAIAAEVECLGNADHLVAVSEPLKARLAARGLPANRITSLPNGVNTSRFSPAADDGAVRDRYALKGRRVIGFVGSLKPWHGLEFLFDLVRQIGTRRSDHCLLLVGDGPGLEYAKSRAEEDGLKNHVVLTGRVRHDEIPAYLAAMDVTIAPYAPQEDFYFSPLKVMESLAAGRPVVAPRLGQLIEVIEDGSHGFLYEPHDLSGCAERVELLLSDLARRDAMSKRARAYAVANLSWERTVGRAIDIMSNARAAA